MEHSQRSLSLGLQTILMRAFGTVPGPIVFGFVMDRTCVLWRTHDEAVTGSCLIYDNFSMSISVLGIVMAWRLAAAVFFAVALHFNKTSHVADVEDEHEETKHSDRS